MRNPPLDLAAPVDEEAARQIAQLANTGRADEAIEHANSTSNPRGNTLLAFRHIDPVD